MKIDSSSELLQSLKDLEAFVKDNQTAKAQKQPMQSPGKILKITAIN